MTRTYKNALLLAAACAALSVGACKKDSADSVKSAPPPSTADAILPDGMPPQPDRTVAPLSPPSETMPLTTANALGYNGKPVDPLCFLQTWNQDAEKPVIDLTACDNPDIARINDANLYTAPAGFNGAAYRPANMAEADSAGVAFVEYRYLGNIGTNAAVLLRESGGGSGLFTTLYLLQRDGDKLNVVEPVAGGDRCNGGIVEAQVIGDKLIYEENLTPLTLYIIGGGPATDEADNLPDCASCCYATAKYEGDTLSTVKVNGNLGTVLERLIAETPDGNTTAACFDALMLSHIKKGEMEFTLPQANDFSREVKGQCLEKQGTASDETFPKPEAEPAPVPPADDEDGTIE